MLRRSLFALLALSAALALCAGALFAQQSAEQSGGAGGDGTIAFRWRWDRYTATGNGAPITAVAFAVKSYAIQVEGTGAAATAWNVALECSLDGDTYKAVVTHASADGDADGDIVGNGANALPCLYIRSRVVTVTLGSATSLVVTIVGMQ